jgi:hypothetical protein
MNIIRAQTQMSQKLAQAYARIPLESQNNIMKKCQSYVCSWSAWVLRRWPWGLFTAPNDPIVVAPSLQKLADYGRTVPVRCTIRPSPCAPSPGSDWAPSFVGWHRTSPMRHRTKRCVSRLLARQRTSKSDRWRLFNVPPDYEQWRSDGPVN